MCTTTYRYFLVWRLHHFTNLPTKTNSNRTPRNVPSCVPCIKGNRNEAVRVEVPVSTGEERSREWHPPKKRTNDWLENWKPWMSWWLFPGSHVNFLRCTFEMILALQPRVVVIWRTWQWILLKVWFDFVCSVVVFFVWGFCNLYTNKKLSITKTLLVGKFCAFFQPSN